MKSTMISRWKVNGCPPPNTYTNVSQPSPIKVSQREKERSGERLRERGTHVELSPRSVAQLRQRKPLDRGGRPPDRKGEEEDGPEGEEDPSAGGV